MNPTFSFDVTEKPRIMESGSLPTVGSSSALSALCNEVFCLPEKGNEYFMFRFEATDNPAKVLRDFRLIELWARFQAILDENLSFAEFVQFSVATMVHFGKNRDDSLDKDQEEENVREKNPKILTPIFPTMDNNFRVTVIAGIFHEEKILAEKAVDCFNQMVANGELGLYDRIKSIEDIFAINPKIAALVGKGIQKFVDYQRKVLEASARRDAEFKAHQDRRILSFKTMILNKFEELKSKARDQLDSNPSSSTKIEGSSSSRGIICLDDSSENIVLPSIPELILKLYTKHEGYKGHEFGDIWRAKTDFYAHLLHQFSVFGLNDEIPITINAFNFVLCFKAAIGMYSENYYGMSSSDALYVFTKLKYQLVQDDSLNSLLHRLYLSASLEELQIPRLLHAFT